MKINKKCLSSLLLALIFTGCNLSLFPELKKIPSPKSGLRVGYALRSPFVMRNKNEQLTGLEIDLLKKFAEQRKYELEFVEYPLNELVFAVRRGEVDIIVAGFMEREIVGLFLAPVGTHMVTGQRVIVNADIAPYITDCSQLDNEKITVYTVVGTPAYEQAEEIFPNANCVSLKDTADCIKKVIGAPGNIFLLNARDAVTIVAADNPELGLTMVLGLLSKERLAWGASRKKEKWHKELDHFAEKMRQNGELQRLIEKNRTEQWDLLFNPSIQIMNAVNCGRQIKSVR